MISANIQACKRPSNAKAVQWSFLLFARQTLFRTVQESLTNIQKHGQGVEHILAKLEYTPEIVHLLVSNDGETHESTSTDPIGFGLKGLKERVDQLRGDFCCGPEAAGGFKVDVRLPLEEVIDDQSAAG